VFAATAVAGEVGIGRPAAIAVTPATPIGPVASGGGYDNVSGAGRRWSTRRGRRLRPPRRSRGGATRSRAPSARASCGRGPRASSCPLVARWSSGSTARWPSRTTGTSRSTSNRCRCSAAERPPPTSRRPVAPAPFVGGTQIITPPEAPPVAAAGSGTVDVSGSGTGSAAAAGVGTVGVVATSGTATAPVTGTGSLTVTSSGTARAAVTGSGVVALSGTGIAAPGGSVPASGTRLRGDRVSQRSRRRVRRGLQRPASGRSRSPARRAQGSRHGLRGDRPRRRRHGPVPPAVPGLAHPVRARQRAGGGPPPSHVYGTAILEAVWP
jgi:hypothetical protein